MPAFYSSAGGTATSHLLRRLTRSRLVTPLRRVCRRWRSDWTNSCWRSTWLRR